MCLPRFMISAFAKVVPDCTLCRSDMCALRYIIYHHPFWQKFPATQSAIAYNNRSMYVSMKIHRFGKPSLPLPHKSNPVNFAYLNMVIRHKRIAFFVCRKIHMVSPLYRQFLITVKGNGTSRRRQFENMVASCLNTGNTSWVCAFNHISQYLWHIRLTFSLHYSVFDID